MTGNNNDCVGCFEQDQHGSNCLKLNVILSFQANIIAQFKTVKINKTWFVSNLQIILFLSYRVENKYEIYKYSNEQRLNLINLIYD